MTKWRCIVQAIASKGLANQKRAWIAQGLHVCRHGAFFDAPGPMACPCMEPVDANDPRWLDAKRMPALDSELRVLTAVPFEATAFSRLRLL